MGKYKYVEDCMFCNGSFYGTDWQKIMVEVLVQVIRSLQEQYLGKTLMINQTAGCIDTACLFTKLKDLSLDSAMEAYSNEECITVQL